jgi:hypothetical protein
MRRSLLPALLLLLLAPSAGAAPIERAFEANLALFSGLVPPVYLSGSGVATLQVTGDHLDGLSFPAGVFDTMTTATIPGLEVRVDAMNGAGTLATGAGPSGGFGGAIPVLGTLRICLGGGCDASPFLDVSLPLNVVGAGGTTSTGGGTFVVSGAPWSTGPVTLSGTGFVSYFSGFRVGPGGLTSSTALPGGFLSVVTPAHVSVPSVGGIDFVAVLDVQFVPEPAAALLAAVGLVGLGALSRRRA